MTSNHCREYPARMERGEQSSVQQPLQRIPSKDGEGKTKLCPATTTENTQQGWRGENKALTSNHCREYPARMERGKQSSVQQPLQRIPSKDGEGKTKL